MASFTSLYYKNSLHRDYNLNYNHNGHIHSKLKYIVQV